MQVTSVRRVQPRYAGASLAMATAAAVAIAPVSASAAQLAAPPIISEIGDAAGAIGNWLAESGMKLVTDPITGITTLVTDQIDNATVIGGAVAESGQQLVASLIDGLPKAVETALADAEAGDLGGAWQDIAFAFTGPVLAGLLGLMQPVMNQLDGQIGPFADGFQAAITPIAVGVLFGLSGVVNAPKAVLTALSDAMEAMESGDPLGAMQTLLVGFGDAGKTLIDATIGKNGALTSALGILPAFLGGIAGSDWADGGPFGGLIPGATPTATTLAAAQAGPLPTGDDLIGAGTALANWLAETGMSFAGDPVGSITDLLSQQAGNATAIGQTLLETLQKLPTAYAEGLPATFEKVFGDLTSGDLGQAWTDGFGGVLGPGLLPSLTLLESITAPVFEQTGPIGVGIQKAFTASLVAGIPLLLAAGSVPTAFLDGVSDAAALLQSGDPFGAANAMVGGLMGLGTSALDTGTAMLSSSMGILPAFVGGMAGSSWATSGPLSGDAPAAASAGTMTPFAQPSTKSLTTNPTSIPDLTSSSDTTNSAPAASNPAPTGSTSDGAAGATGTQQSGTAGDAGKSGDTGKSGGTGDSGSTGAAGDAGSTGGAGSTGTSGDTGSSGETGSSGDTGASGTAGNTGTSDASGGSADGATGADSGAASSDTGDAGAASSDTGAAGSASSDAGSGSDSSDSAGSVDAAA